MLIEETKSDTYKLSKQYFDHKSGVRCIDMHQGNTIITGSIDKTCQIYNKLNDSFDVKASQVQYAKGFVYSVRIFDQGYIIGSQDKNIYVLDKDLQLVQTLIGHQGPVNSLVYKNGKLISGSWDGTAKIWDLSTGVCEETLEGHKFAVCIALLSNGLILTGSSDKCIRIWSKTDKYIEIKVINGAHGDIIRELNEISDFGFISCSNDETVKIWTYEGDEIQTIRGHNSFVYSAKCLSFGKYVTCSEDKTLKIWNSEECIQTILHPGTIWCLAIDSSTGTIVTGCADGVTRIFSTNAND